MKPWIRRLWPVAVVVGFACYPGRFDAVGDFDSVSTVTAPGADFAGITTFSLQDSVVHLVPPGDEDEVDHTLDAFTLDRTRQNLLALGWTEIVAPDANNEPDVVVQVAATSSTYIGYTYPWWAYWGYWWGWGYGPGWGVGYPPVIIPYEFSTGTLLLQMLDLRGTDSQNPAGTLPVIWIAGANGLLDGASNAELQVRIGQAIDQAFEQTPQLVQP